jgi:YOP proteins translocation protein K (YscK)
MAQPTFQSAFGPPPQSLRQRRGFAAGALAQHARRGQLAWADLAAWPDWAVGLDAAAQADAPAAVQALATRVGAVWHAEALHRCIHGATLKRLQQVLGEDTLQLLCKAHTTATGRENHQRGSEGPEDAQASVLPPADQIESWLQAQGAEVMLAALPSPLLRLLLRDRLWPKTLAQLPAAEMAAAARAVQRAQALPLPPVTPPAGRSASASASPATAPSNKVAA